jgi:uncharacterized protein (TIGR02453 family)
MDFHGFPPEALDFLSELDANNERAWFEQHRADYDRLLLQPARAFVEAMRAPLERLAPGVRAEPRVNGSILRMHRDTRFSKDKRPLKTHLDLWFWQGGGPSRAAPGFFLRLQPGRLALGAGMHHFEPELLERYRRAVADPERGEALVRAAAAVRRAGFELGTVARKRPPAGYDVPPERAPFLLHHALHAYVAGAVPQEAHDERFPAYCLARFRKLRPLQRWLHELVAGAPAGAAT